MPCWVWPQVYQRKERSCLDVIIPPHPTPPHPTSPHLETMPCWVWLQVCQRKERSCQDVIIPPHPTPPHPPGIWRRCYVDCGRNCGADVGFWVMRMVVGEWPFLVAKSSCFGCEILLFWLQNRLFLVAESVIFGCGIGYFLVAEAPFFGCGSVSDFGCGIAEIWLRKRRNMVSESDFIPLGKPQLCGYVVMRWHYHLRSWETTNTESIYNTLATCTLNCAAEGYHITQMLDTPSIQFKKVTVLICIACIAVACATAILANLAWSFHM